MRYIGRQRRRNEMPEEPKQVERKTIRDYLVNGERRERDTERSGSGLVRALEMLTPIYGDIQLWNSFKKIPGAGLGFKLFLQTSSMAMKYATYYVVIDSLLM